MRYVSTRGRAPALGFSAAIEAGLATDGGLYVPEVFPRADLDGVSTGDLATLAMRILTPYLEGDPLAPHVASMAASALSFPIPLRDLPHRTALLELFHGPTAAFKDVGARFLAECVARSDDPRRGLVLVATSGDTGGAVAAAFHGRPGIDVAILYPSGKISARQEKQLTTWGDNVRAFAVRGTFDDCQRLVKLAFTDEELRKRRRLLSANSISIGRLLPQVVYHAHAALAYRRAHGVTPGFIVPTGNLGDAVACLWAKRAGLPIGRVVLATNANRPIVEYLRTGKWKPAQTIATLANAMDVGDPSNMERLRHLYPTVEAMRRDVGAVSVTDEEIRDVITRGERDWGQVFCPHTATGMRARELSQADHWVVVATAHPAKFETIVEPLIGHAVEVPPALAALLEKPSSVTEIEPDDKAVDRIIG